MLMAIAAIGGVLVTLGLLVLGVANFVCARMDRRFDELKEQRQEDRTHMDKQFAGLKEQRQEDRTRMDRQFADLKEQRQEDQARMDKQFDELKVLIREALKVPR